MRKHLDYRASVNFIPDLNEPASTSVTPPIDLARAVRIAVTKHRLGRIPAIMGEEVNLIGIDSILAVRELDDFPDEVHQRST